MTKIIVNGFQGSMGKVVCSLIKEDKNCEITAGIDIYDENSMMPFPTFIDINSCDMMADVIIDFSTNTATSNLIDYCLRQKLPLVLCTTGLSEDNLKKVEDASKHIPIFRSSNMSMGINLICNILKKYSKILSESGFDIEIIEKHHNKKIDAPSGTALLLAETINNSMDNKFNYIYDRSKVKENRNTDQIGISSIRGGTIVGEHSIIFAGNCETIEFKHSALSKELFGVGAINAAKFIVGKPPKIYNMEDLIENSI